MRLMHALSRVMDQIIQRLLPHQRRKTQTRKLAFLKCLAVGQFSDNWPEPIYRAQLGGLYFSAWLLIAVVQWNGGEP